MNDVIDFEKEKNKLIKKYACPECSIKGTYCPEWIMNYDPYSREFSELSLEEIMEWIHHAG